MSSGNWPPVQNGKRDRITEVTLSGAGDTINWNGEQILVVTSLGGADRVLTATPTITNGITPRNGERVSIVNLTSNTMTFQDENDVSGTTIKVPYINGFLGDFRKIVFEWSTALGGRWLSVDKTRPVSELAVRVGSTGSLPSASANPSTYAFVSSGTSPALYYSNGTTWLLMGPVGSGYQNKNSSFTTSPEIAIYGCTVSGGNVRVTLESTAAGEYRTVDVIREDAGNTLDVQPSGGGTINGVSGVTTLTTTQYAGHRFIATGANTWLMHSLGG
jgi:hypothetical protein